MKNKWKLFNIVLAVLVVASLTVNIVLFTQLSAEKEALSSLQDNLSSTQEKLAAVNEKLTAAQAELEAASHVSDDTIVPLSSDTVLKNGSTLGDARKVIDNTRGHLKDMGYTDDEITPQLEDLAVQMGTTLNAVESLPDTDNAQKTTPTKTTDGGKTSTTTTSGKTTTPTKSNTTPTGSSDPYAGDKNHNGINDAFEGCTITDEEAATITSDHSECGTLNAN